MMVMMVMVVVVLIVAMAILNEDMHYHKAGLNSIKYSKNLMACSDGGVRCTRVARQQRGL